MLAVLPYVAVAVILRRCFPERFTMRFLPSWGFWASGAVTGVAGAAVYVAALVRLRHARRAGELATTGPYARIRHPIHAAWMCLIVPGTALAARSWVLLATPLVYYLVFRFFIRSEEADLVERFGSVYIAYRERTALIWPFHRKQRP